MPGALSRTNHLPLRLPSKVTMLCLFSGDKVTAPYLK
jgi:hypothetical protein